MTFGKLENKYTYKCESHLKSKLPAGVLLPPTFEGRLLILTHLKKNYGHNKSQHFSKVYPNKSNLSSNKLDCYKTYNFFEDSIYKTNELINLVAIELVGTCL